MNSHAELKSLRKKYPSFDKDYESFLDELEKHPFSGEALGQHTFKVRMAIASKGKGKKWWGKSYHI
jgi:hypothetical protein